MSDPKSFRSLGVFAAALASASPFREDSALVPSLLDEADPVLSALARGYRSGGPVPGVEARASMREQPPLRATLSEGFALFNLLCRRAGVLGATPTVCLVLARAVVLALRSEGIELSPASIDDLMVVAVEGYSAGRDELRERSLRASAERSQVLFPLAAHCYFACLADNLLPDQLERILDDFARQLFRAEARVVLLDISRLDEPGEDAARALVSFLRTLDGLGVELWLHESAPRFAAWFAKLELSVRVRQAADLGDGITRALAAAGYEVHKRGRLGELLDKVKSL